MKGTNIKVGDIITAYHKGFHRVTEIQKRHGTTPLIYYYKVLDSNYNKCKPKKNCCDAYWCERITLEGLKKEFERQCAHFQTKFKIIETLLSELDKETKS